MEEKDPRDRILEKAAEKFFALGYRRITMDEIANELGMSKKTLYKYFPTKADLLKEITNHFIQEAASGQDRIMSDTSLDFDKRLSGVMKAVAQIVAKVSPSFAQDVQRSAPHIWETIEKTRQQRIQMVFGSLLAEGQQKGLIRQDLNLPFLVFLLAEMIRETVNPTVVSQFSVSLLEAFETVRTVFLRGVLTDQGRSRFLNTSASAGSQKETWP